MRPYAFLGPRMTTLEPGTIAQWVGAFATFSAVLVALFKDPVVRYWRRPKLKVVCVLAPPDCHLTRMTVLPNGPSADCYYLRLWVENVGMTRAEMIQVFAAKLSRKSADGTFREIPEFLPMNLKWSHTGEIFAPGISPSMGKHCDLGHLLDPQYQKLFGHILEGVPDNQTILGLDLEMLTFTGTHLIRPGTYQMLLRVAGANCAVVEKTIELSVTGAWFAQEDRMFKEGLGLRVVG
jgi:hypothetical protein